MQIQVGQCIGKFTKIILTFQEIIESRVTLKEDKNQ